VKAGSWWFRDLYVNGVRCERPRIPGGPLGNQLLTIRSIPDLSSMRATVGRADEVEFAPGDLNASWTNPTDVEVVVLHMWVESRLPVTSIDGGSKIVTFGKRSVFRLTQSTTSLDPAHYYVENVFSALNGPASSIRTGSRGSSTTGRGPSEQIGDGPGHRARLAQSRARRGQERPVSNLTFAG